MNTEDLLLSIIDGLRGCLCSTLAGADAEVCRCANYPGAYAPADACSCGAHGCGQAWVRLDRLYPSDRFPATSSAPGNCGNTLVAVLEAGVYRCRPVPGRNGTAPSEAAVTASGLAEARDAVLVAKAIACCPIITRRPHVLGTWLPRDSADCGGGAWTVSVQLIHAPGDET